MEIFGQEIDNRYVAIAGAGGLGLLFFLTRGDGSDEEQFAYLRPAEGLTWDDVLDGDDSGKVPFPGPPGLPGPPGPPGTAPPAAPPQDRPGRRGDRCSRNRDCGGRLVCLNGECVPPGVADRERDRERPERERPEREPRFETPEREPRDVRDPRDRDPRERNERDRNGNRDFDRPRMPNRNPDIDDPRLDNPRDRRRRDEGSNRFSGPDTGRKDFDIIRRGGTEIGRNADADGGIVDIGDIGRGVTGRIDVGGGTAISRDRGRNSGTARARADGGNVRTGNVRNNPRGDTRVIIEAGGGRAQADASGGNRQGNQEVGRKVRRLFGRGGEAFYGESTLFDSQSVGRNDGFGGQPAGYIRTNPNPGSTVGGFMPVSQPITQPGETATIRSGETLRGLARRKFGDPSRVPRIYALNQSLLMGRTEIPAGTKFRI